MNMSKAVSHLKMALGLYAVGLPFKDSETGATTPTENVIRDVLTTMTIPIYSQFVPWTRELDANVKVLKVVDRLNHVYMLPQGLCTTPVMYVSRVELPISSNRGTFGDIAPQYGISRSVQGVNAAQAMMMLAGQMRSEPTWEYLGENKIRLYGFPHVVLKFVAACEHEPNGETIPQGCYDSFMQLAELDMKVFLYNTLKMYDNIPTAFGNINLKIEEYQGASGEREALLNQWRDVYHLDQGWENWM